jgi:hypothetical protein
MAYAGGVFKFGSVTFSRWQIGTQIAGARGQVFLTELLADWRECHMSQYNEPTRFRIRPPQ